MQRLSALGSARYSRTIELNHSIVPTLDKEASARFFAQIFGLSYEGPTGHFAPVQVNGALTLDFANAKAFDSHHLAFKVSEEEFDAIFARVQAEGIPYGSGLWVANYYSARNPLRLSSLVILGVVARMFRCATRSSCWCT